MFLDLDFKSFKKMFTISAIIENMIKLWIFSFLFRLNNIHSTIYIWNAMKWRKEKKRNLSIMKTEKRDFTKCKYGIKENVSPIFSSNLHIPFSVIGVLILMEKKGTKVAEQLYRKLVKITPPSHFWLAVLLSQDEMTLLNPLVWNPCTRLFFIWSDREPFSIFRIIYLLRLLFLEFDRISRFSHIYFIDEVTAK